MKLKRSTIGFFIVVGLTIVGIVAVVISGKKKKVVEKKKGIFFLISFLFLSGRSYKALKHQEFLLSCHPFAGNFL